MAKYWCRGMAVATWMALTWAAPAAAQQPAGSWRFDEGSGLVARDSGPRHLHGTLAPQGDPAWIPGVTGSALRFQGNGHVALPDNAALEPPAITISAWVRRAGTPGTFRYVFSKGASGCVRSSYGLYTASEGGAAFYIAGDGMFTVSPQVAPSAVWDGRWHRLSGSYDGARVRVYLDGAQVGAGTPGPTHIEYGLTSTAPYIGTYNGTCALPFGGDLDGVALWGSALTAAQMRADALPPPAAPPSALIGPGPGSPGSGTLQIAKGVSTTPEGCTSIRVRRRSVLAGRRSAIVATVRRGLRHLAGARVVLRARALRKVARTGARGRARLVVRPWRTLTRLKLAVRSKQPARCGSPVAYVRVRRPAA